MVCGRFELGLQHFRSEISGGGGGGGGVGFQDKP